jgi:hypothetical protein
MLARLLAFARLRFARPKALPLHALEHSNTHSDAQRTNRRTDECSPERNCRLQGPNDRTKSYHGEFARYAGRLGRSTDTAVRSTATAVRSTRSSERDDARPGKASDDRLGEARTRTTIDDAARSNDSRRTNRSGDIERTNRTASCDRP